jgi:5-methylthioadenosine/S-adenosylhomocysteine deaminase
VPELLSRGINIALGTDGPASNNHQSMVREVQQLSRKQKVINLDPMILTARTCLQIATLNGAAAYGKSHQLGSLDAGKLADLIFINPEAAHWYPHYDPYAGIVYAMRSEDVDSVMVNGEFIMRGRKLTRVDETEIIARAKELPKLIASLRPEGRS